MMPLCQEVFFPIPISYATSEFLGVELLEARWEVPTLPPSSFPLIPKAYLKSPKTDHQDRKKILGKVCNHRKLAHSTFL